MKRTIQLLTVLLALVLLALAGAGCTAKVKKSYHLSRANHFYGAGELRSAEIEYLNVLRYDGTNQLAYGRLGQIYYDQGRLDRALFFLARGSELAPDNLDLRLKLGFLDSTLGHYTQAVAQATFILDRKPQTDEAVLLLAEGAVAPKDQAAARQRLQLLARGGDRAVIEVALGNLALRNRDVTTADADYQKARALDPKSPAVNVALAAAAWAHGDLKQADLRFKAAADASPARSPRQMQYARFKLESGDLAGAQAVLNKTLKSAPDYLPAAMLLAQIAASEKKYDESVNWVNYALAVDPDNFDAQLFQAQLARARGAPDQAVPILERLTRAYPQAAQAHFELGAACFAANNFSKAADSLQRALELNPNLEEATLLLARLQIKSGNSAPALVALETLCQKHPQLVQGQLLLAEVYRLQSRVGEALRIYRTLEKAYPTNAQVKLLRGAALLQTGDKAGARSAFEQALALAPDDVHAIEQLVDLDLAGRQFTDAAQLVNRLIQAHPKQAALRILAAKIQHAQGQRDQALATLAEALAIDPGNLGAYLLQAQLYSEAGASGKALEKLDAVMALDPKNVSALMLAAEIYEANKDYPGAAGSYEKLIAIDPKWSPALNNLAWLYSEQLNRLDRAYELARRAHDLLPYSPEAADTLGWICYRRGDYPTALGLLQDAVAKIAAAPGRKPIPEIWYHLGMASYMIGDEAAARTALQQAVQSGAKFNGRAEADRFLVILNIAPARANATDLALLEKRKAESPGDSIALSRLARCYQLAGDTAKAIADYEACLQAMPKNLDALVNLAQLYAATDTRKAYELAKTANNLAPYDPKVLPVLGRLALASGDGQLAASSLQQALQNQPNDSGLLFDYGRAAYGIGRIADAQSALQNALAQHLTGPAAAQARRTLDLIGLAAAPAQAEAAGARIAEALKSDPNDVPALMAQAAVSEYHSDRAGAEQACERVLAHAPDFTPAQMQLARLYLAEPAKLDRAYNLADHLYAALPDNLQVAKLMGMVLVRRGDYNRASNLLQECASRTNSDAEILYYLGAAQFHLKNRAGCKANLQQALALSLAGPLADSAKQMLEQLK